jgi:hypothetical protein
MEGGDTQEEVENHGGLSGDPAKTPAVCRSSRASATLQAAGDRKWPDPVLDVVDELGAAPMAGQYGKAQPEASRTERDRGPSSSTPAGRPVARVSENSRLRARGSGGSEGMSRVWRYVSAPAIGEARCGRRGAGAVSGGADGWLGRMGVKWR